MLSSNSKSLRQAFFAQFSSRVMDALKKIEIELNIPKHLLPLVILTGGLRTPAHLYTVLSSNHADLLGIGRSSLLCPSLPSVLRRLEESSSSQDKFTSFKALPEPDLSLSFTQKCPWSWMWSLVPKIKLVGAGVGMAWYLIAARIWATSFPSDEEGEAQLIENLYRVGGLEAVLRMWIWTLEPPFSRSWGRTAISVLLFAMVVYLYTFWTKAFPFAQSIQH